MKKLFITCLLLVMLSINASSQLRFGGELGLNMSYFKQSASGVTVNWDNLIGPRAGIILDNAFSDNWSFQPGIFYTMMGAKISVTGTNESVTLNYLQIPINIIGRFDAGSGKFCIGAGPYLSFALSGTEKSGSTSVDINFGSGGDFKTTDYGFTINAAYETPIGIFFRLSYDYGLANIANGATANNVSTHISLGYFFGH